MAAFVQAVNAQANNTVAVTTAGITTTSGNCLIAIAVANGSAGVTDAATPLTDSKGNTWTEAPIGGAITATLTNSMRVFVASNITGGAAHTVTYTETAGTFNYPSIVVFEFSSMATASPGDVNANSQATQAATGTTLNSGSMTTLNASDVLIGGGADTGAGGENQSFSAALGGGTYTVPTGGKNDNAALTPIAAAYQIVSATGTYQVTYNTGQATSVVQAAVIASFKQAGGAAPAPVQSPMRTLTGAGI